MFDLKVSQSNGESSPLCLEFANTVRWHAREQPEETIHVYSDLVSWARGLALISDREAQKLLGGATSRPSEADRALKSALTLRESIYRIFLTLVRGKLPADTDIAELNSMLTKTTSGGRVIKTADGFAWVWEINEEGLDSLTGSIALSAVELLLSNERQRVGQCADDRGCGWLFLDTSKNHSRRWCDINDCGNRAKQHRYYQRKRQSA